MICQINMSSRADIFFLPPFIKRGHCLFLNGDGGISIWVILLIAVRVSSAVCVIWMIIYVLACVHYSHMCAEYQFYVHLCVCVAFSTPSPAIRDALMLLSLVECRKLPALHVMVILSTPIFEALQCLSLQYHQPLPLNRNISHTQWKVEFRRPLLLPWV